MAVAIIASLTVLVATNHLALDRALPALLAIAASYGLYRRRPTSATDDATTADSESNDS